MWFELQKLSQFFPELQNLINRILPKLEITPKHNSKSFQIKKIKINDQVSKPSILGNPHECPSCKYKYRQSLPEVPLKMTKDVEMTDAPSQNLSFILPEISTPSHQESFLRSLLDSGIQYRGLDSKEYGPYRSLTLTLSNQEQISKLITLNCKPIPLSEHLAKIEQLKLHIFNLPTGCTPQFIKTMIKKHCGESDVPVQILSNSTGDKSRPQAVAYLDKKPKDLLLEKSPILENKCVVYFKTQELAFTPSHVITHLPPRANEETIFNTLLNKGINPRMVHLPTIDGKRTYQWAFFQADVPSDTEIRCIQPYIDGRNCRNPLCGFYNNHHNKCKKAKLTKPNNNDQDKLLW